MKKQNILQLFIGLALLAAISCTPDTPDFELGRYTYAGIDNKTFRFFRVENGGAFREVSAKKTGIGAIAAVPFCDEDAFGTSFYDCGLFPNLPKPYFEFKENEAEIAIFYAPDEEILKETVPYTIEGDSLVLGTPPDVLKLPRPTGNKNREILWPWRISMSSKFKFSSVDLILESLSEKEHLQAVQEQEKLAVGDTIALCLLKEKFVKQK